MKQLLFCFVLITFFSCNSNDKKANKEAGKETSTPANTAKGDGEMKDGIADYTNNKESFMLPCNIDGRLALGGEKATDAQVSQFCECAWEKTKGKYPAEVMANNSKLEKHPVLKECYENAKSK